MADKKVRSVAKTFSWRFFIFLYWLVFGYIFTGTFKGASILGLGSIIPLFFYLQIPHDFFRCCRVHTDN